MEDQVRRGASRVGPRGVVLLTPSVITTYTGREFRPLRPRVGDVDIRVIAHSLSMICRFNGHVARFYSVAEHCVLVSLMVPPSDALAGLLHDAAEAYVADVSTPVKRARGFAFYRRTEDRILAAVLARFGLLPPLPWSVHCADQRLVVEEARRLFLSPPAWTDGLPGAPDAAIVGLPPEQAEVLYLDRFRELFGCE